MGKKIKDQPIEELTKMLKTLHKKEKIQSQMIKKFCKLMYNDGFHSTILNDFSYPLAVFEQNGDLVFVNNALSLETGLNKKRFGFWQTQYDQSCYRCEPSNT